ncbi:MAG: hypothetical protein K8U57_27085 [Planctomycetes bacterium]|nr:hypothetical protein [Planctomycetota bacterium]
MTRLRMAWASVLFVFVAGCSGPGIAPVEGTVTYKGEPLKDGTILFHPEKGRPAAGKIRDGKIVEVTTETLNDGVPVGSVRVAIQAITNPDKMDAPHKSLIPEKYGDPDKSELTADIKPGKNDLKFELK